MGSGQPLGRRGLLAAWCRAPRTFRYLLPLVLLSSLCMSLLVGAYSRARDDAVERLYEEERILASQAATGIAEYFAFYEQSLAFLANNAAVAADQAEGRRLLREFFAAQSGKIASVSRVDAEGRLAYTYPYEANSGMSIADQPHVRAFLSARNPLLSGVFQSVQGFPAVALYYPTWEGAAFRGGVAVLVPFAELSRRYLEGVGVGSSGYALLLDTDGRILYSPEGEIAGKLVRDLAQQYPGALSLFEETLGGGAGRGAYDLPRPAGPGAASSRALAYFTSVPAPGALWKVVVAAPEAEAFALMKDFRDRWFAVAGLLVLAFIVWAYTLLRTMGKLSESNRSLESANAALQGALADLEGAQAKIVAAEKLAALGQLAASLAHQLNTPLGAIVSASESIVSSLREDLGPALARYGSLPPAARSAADGLLALSAARLSSGDPAAFRPSREAAAG